MHLCRSFVAPVEGESQGDKRDVPDAWSEHRVRHRVRRRVCRRPAVTDSHRGYHFMPMEAFFWYDAVSVSLPFGMFLQVNDFAGQRSRISPLHRILPCWRRSQPYLYGLLPPVLSTVTFTVPF